MCSYKDYVALSTIACANFLSRPLVVRWRIQAACLPGVALKILWDIVN